MLIEFARRAIRRKRERDEAVKAMVLHLATQRLFPAGRNLDVITEALSVSYANNLTGFNVRASMPESVFQRLINKYRLRPVLTDLAKLSLQE